MDKPSTAPLLAIRELGFHYGAGKLRQRILEDISTDIYPGEIIILTGPSGSGKTTLLTLVGALRSMQRGSLRIFGRELNGASARMMQSVRRQIGYIFQGHNLIDALTVSQNVAMSVYLHPDIKRRDALPKAEEMLAAVGLVEHRHKYPAELSGGQKQRVAIARALVARPRMVLADEPTASLDRHAGREVVELMRRLAQEQQVTVIIVTHDNRILDVADRILHLEDGRIQSLSGAIAENASQLLTLLGKHDPDRSLFISTFSQALARVAFSDRHVTDEERHAMRDALLASSGLLETEVDLVVELAMAQVQWSAREEPPHEHKPFSALQRDQFLAALYSVANADGAVSPEERSEINAIATEMGFPEP
jgi:putative ABC transport system ATP-binding protein